MRVGNRTHYRIHNQSKTMKHIDNDSGIGNNEMNTIAGGGGRPVAWGLGFRYRGLVCLDSRFRGNGDDGLVGLDSPGLGNKRRGNDGRAAA